MRLNPSSGINAKNGEVILRFLLYYMHQREREHAEPESELAPSEENTELQPGAAELNAATEGALPSADDSYEVRMQDSQTSLTEAQR